MAPRGVQVGSRPRPAPSLTPTGAGAARARAGPAAAPGTGLPCRRGWRRAEYRLARGSGVLHRAIEGALGPRPQEIELALQRIDAALERLQGHAVRRHRQLGPAV